MTRLKYDTNIFSFSDKERGERWELNPFTPNGRRTLGDELETVASYAYDILRNREYTDEQKEWIKNRIVITSEGNVYLQLRLDAHFANAIEQVATVSIQIGLIRGSIYVFDPSQWNYSEEDTQALLASIGDFKAGEEVDETIVIPFGSTSGSQFEEWHGGAFNLYAVDMRQQAA